ncbi:efflux RND transporter permease subunit [Arcticibacterium luteifluviistationis]|uniref:Patched family protein n=1 Tax=Arcticibacterium luteifluviistationis TaxID=1784714 RepID=A0A2Z4GBW0_9BACT|nr:efflux RND transporter permease subunit [Arcticibacterium luteifluviistationis]AWV98686.1 patched family protein [Arcticibacterium luteifluviistationis]
MSSKKRFPFLQNFWEKVADVILKNRIAWIVVISIITGFMVYMTTQLQLSYELPKILPQSDEHYQRYEAFKDRYGEDGNVMVIAIKTDDIYSLDTYNKWFDLGQDLKKIDGIKNIASICNLFEIRPDEVQKKFNFIPISPEKPNTQAEVDTIKSKINKYPFYKGFLFSDDGTAHLMAVTFDQEKMNSKSRMSITQGVEDLAQAFGESTGIKPHYSGMPFVRTNFMSKVSLEVAKFMILAFLVTAIILFLFFRSFRVVFFALLVIAISVLWSVGLIQIFGYKITLLTGLVPSIIVVIGIPNSIFLINKYQEEYLKCKNQIKALKISIEKIGKTTFIANLTTFIGFFVFYFTGSPLLLEFGLVASIAVMATWALSLILIPIIFSYNPKPKAKHVRHLDNKNISKFLEKVDFIVHNRRSMLYWIIGVLIVLSVFGMTKIKSIGHLVDDLPANDPVFTDLKFIEENFKGIVPIEVSIDTKTENGALDPEVLTKIRLVQREFAKYPELTKPISIVEAIKFVYQGYRGGDEKYYRLPGALELNKLAAYSGMVDGNEKLMSSFMDSTRRYTRISYQSGDVGTVRMGEMIAALQAKTDTIFNYDSEFEEWLAEEEQIDAKLTGNGVVFTKGNDYLLSNLRDSTILAIILVSLVMATQFLNARTVLISTIPSIIPLIITAGIMGFFAIPLKPTTILIFSIAFGIASDGTIYFLTKYKEEIESGKTISEAVSETIKLSGISMFYTAIILFFGFGIYVVSGFKGTVFLGLLVSMTLLIGMISNLILLPSFLMTLDNRQSKKLDKAVK